MKPHAIGGKVRDFRLEFSDNVLPHYPDDQAVPLPPAITHTIHMDVGGERWHQLRDMRAAYSAEGSIEFAAGPRFTCRRRLAPLIKRKRARLWLLDRGWLRISPPATMRIDFPQVEYAP